MPTIFGVSHIVFLLISTVLIVAGLIIIKKFVKSKRMENHILISTALVLLVLIILNRFSITFWNPEGIDYTELAPMTLCGMTSLLLALSALVFVKKQNHSVFHFLIYLAIIGGLANNIYPDYISQASSIFHSRTITGLLHHTVSLFLGLLIIMNGEFKPALKRAYCLPLGLSFYTTLGLFYTQVFSPNPRNTMNIAQPIVPGLDWYILYALAIVIHFVMLFVFEMIAKKRQAAAMIEN